MKRLFYGLSDCLVCETPINTDNFWLCQDCIDGFTINYADTCKVCLNFTINDICNHCQLKPPYYDNMIATYFYTKPLSTFLHKLKYNKKIQYSRILAQLFYKTIIKQVQQLPDIVIPVPIHTNKLLQRGFNQSEELLKYFKNWHNIKIVSAIKLNHTTNQVGLNLSTRVKQMAGSFHLHANLDNKNIAIVDDVVTTGATVNELAKLCKRLGAKHIQIWCLLRTILIGDNSVYK